MENLNSLLAALAGWQGPASTLLHIVIILTLAWLARRLVKHGLKRLRNRMIDGEVDTEREKRLATLEQVARYILTVVILLVAALVTPPDMMSQLILFAAIYPLYEVSIWLIRRIEKKREAQLRAEGLWVDEDED